MKLFLIAGSINAFIAVAFGAFGAHALKEKLSAEMLAIWQTGVQYQMIHAVGLLLIALLSERLAAPTVISWSGWLLLVGIILFSGSLYVLSLSGIRILGAITPLGGVCFLAGWLLLAWAGVRQ